MIYMVAVFLENLGYIISVHMENSIFTHVKCPPHVKSDETQSNPLMAVPPYTVLLGCAH